MVVIAFLLAELRELERIVMNNPELLAKKWEYISILRKGKSEFYYEPAQFEYSNPENFKAMQMIPFPGKLSGISKSTLLKAKSKEIEYEITKRKLIFELRTNYMKAVYTKILLNEYRSLYDYGRILLNSVKALVESNKEELSNYLKLTAFINEIKSNINILETELDTLIYNIKTRILYSSYDFSISTYIAITELKPIYYYLSNAEKSPLYQMNFYETSSIEASKNTKKFDFLPQFGIGYMSLNGERMASFLFSYPIFLPKQVHQYASESAMHTSSRYSTANTLNEVKSIIYTNYKNYEVYKENEKLLSDSLKSSLTALKLKIESYGAAKTDFLEVFDAFEDHIKYMEKYYENLYNLYVSYANVLYFGGSYE